MQNEDKAQIQSLSHLRLELRQLLGDLERSLQSVFGREPLVKGTVYEMARKCGKPSCACARGQLHKSQVLSWSHQGKTRIKSIPADKLEELRRKSKEYLQFRRDRAQVSVICKRMMSVIDRIEALRREDF
jgi:hypothetical protein